MRLRELFQSFVVIYYLYFTTSYNGDKGIVIIYTDGYENASREYSLEKVRHLIKEKEQLGWEIHFIGGDLKNSESIAASINIKKDYVQSFNKADFRGQTISYMTASASSYRDKVEPHKEDSTDTPENT